MAGSTDLGAASDIDDPVRTGGGTCCEVGLALTISLLCKLSWSICSNVRGWGGTSGHPMDDTRPRETKAKRTIGQTVRRDKYASIKYEITTQRQGRNQPT